MPSFDLSLIIPLYNETARLPHMRDELRAFSTSAAHLSHEIILVDDGSSDDTPARLQEFAAGYPQDAGQAGGGPSVQIVSLPRNLGKASALKAGVLAARGKWILTLDADMACSPGQALDWEKKGFLNLKEPAGRERVFFGSREHPESQVQDSLARRLMGRVFNLMAQLTNDVALADTQCGFKLYPGHVAKQCFAALTNMGWAHDVEIVRLLELAGVEIVDLPIKWETRPVSKIKPLIDSCKMAFQLVRIALSVYWRHGLGFVKTGDQGFIIRDRKEVLYQRLSAGLFGLLAIVIAVTFRDYGPYWDEPVQDLYGQLIVRYYSSLFADKTALHYYNLYYYGGLFEAICALFNSFSPFTALDTRHLCNALSGLLGIWACFRLTQLLAGTRAAFWAALLLATLPTYYGHMYFNSKDIPFAAGYALSVYYIIKLLRYFPYPPKGLLVKLSLAIGITLGVRIGGILLFVYLGVVLLYLLLTAARRQTEWKNTAKYFGKLLLYLALPVVVASYVVMLVGWPWAQQNPFLNPVRSLHYMSHFPFIGDVLVAGKLYQSDHLPWDYLPRVFAAQTPELLGILFCLAPLIGGALVIRGKNPTQSWKMLGAALLAFSVFFPVLYVMVTHATLYDNHRHLTFVFPGMACLAALALEALLRWSPPIIGKAIIAAGIGLSAWLVAQMVSMHPYQYVYYNSLVGGVSGAQGKYQLDYWVTGCREAIDKLEQKLRDAPGDDGKSMRYLGDIPPGAGYYLLPRSNLGFSFKSAADFNYGAGEIRQSAHSDAKDQVVMVERNGIKLGEIYRQQSEDDASPWFHLVRWLDKENIDISHVYTTIPKIVEKMNYKPFFTNYRLWLACPLEACKIKYAKLAGDNDHVNLFAKGVDAAEKVGWVDTNPTDLDKAFQGLGLTYSMHTEGELAFFHNFAPLCDYSELDPTDWSGWASLHPENAGAVLDRDGQTSWSGEDFQKPGQLFTLDLGGVREGVCRLRLWSTSPAHLPRALRVETSRDGQNWEAAAEAQGYLSFYWDGGKPRLAGPGDPMEVGFTPRSARWVRLTQTGRGGDTWDMVELAVYARREDSPLALDAGKAAGEAVEKVGKRGSLLASPWAADQFPPFPPLPGQARPAGLKGKGWLANTNKQALLLWPADAEAAQKTLDEVGWEYERSQAGGAVLLRLTGRARNPMPNLTPLPADGWRGVSDLRPEALPHLNDGDSATRWDTGRLQEPGQALTLVFKAPREVAGLRLDASGSPQDFPRDLKLECRGPDGAWQPVAFIWHHQPPLYFDGTHLLSSGGSRRFLTFQPRHAAELRLTLTGVSYTNFWSIHELQVLRP